MKMNVEHAHIISELENLETKKIELNKVYNMDCLAGLSQMPNDYVDAVVTDPPYYIEALKDNLKDSTLRRSSKNNIFYADWDSTWESLEDYKLWFKEVLKEHHRVLKPKAQVYLFMSYHHLDWCIKMIKDMGYRYYKPLIWYKPDTMGVFPNQYGCNYEVILWFRKEGKTGKVKLKIGNSQRDVFKLNSTSIKYRKECGFHPTCKPVKIIRRLIMNCTNENDIVMDCFMGSGTTAVASKEIKRNYIGFEKNHNYIPIIEERLSQTQLYGYSSELSTYTQDEVER